MKDSNLKKILQDFEKRLIYLEKEKLDKNTPQKRETPDPYTKRKIAEELPDGPIKNNQKEV